MKLDYEQLYSQVGLNELHECFLQFVKAKSSTCSFSLLEAAEYLEEFLSEQFGIQQALNAVYKHVSNHSLIAYTRRQFVQRYALKTFPDPQDEWQNLYTFSDTITFANAACDALENSTPNLDNLSKYASWAVLTLQGQQKHKHDSLFHVPEKINPDFTLRNVKKIDHSYITTSPRNREGFDLTDTGFSNSQSISEAHYCILCHAQEKDSCRTGLAHHPKKSGCPLDLKVSQMHALKRSELNIAALAVMMIDNPMVAATGYRICNDCMKSCIFQKQTPVNTPGVETNILNAVLNLPYGFEIYSLLTRWNPLNVDQPLPAYETGYQVLVVGLGPAGFSLAHYLERDGHKVVGIDGAKFEPLPSQLLEKNLIKDVNVLYEKLDERILGGFGGVAEYGITVRWNKNYLKILRLLLERRKNIKFYGSTRYGSQISENNYKSLGFDAVALCTGAGTPKVPSIPGALTSGVRLASDFLMVLQLTGAAKKDSLANLQILGPILVLGGGLTAIDTATEAKAYYTVQAKKFKDRYNQLLEIYGEAEVKKGWSTQDHLDAEQLLTTETVDVRIIYRNDITNAPSYTLNHEEVEKALEEGIVFEPNLIPLRIEKDAAGQVKGLWAKRENIEEFLPARCIIMAVGTHHESLSKIHASFGDANPEYAGSVVKAISSAKNGYKAISTALKKVPPLPKLDLSPLLKAEVMSVTRLAKNLVQVEIHAPLAAAAFVPGQFYRLQNYESSASIIHNTRLAMEALALTPVKVDKVSGILTFVIVEIGCSSLLVQYLKPGESVSLMGPTGTPTELPVNQNVLLIGGGHFNLALIHQAEALKKRGNTVQWLAGYRSNTDRTHVNDMETTADKIWWYYTEAINNEYQGNIIDGIRHLKNENIIQTIDWLFVMGSTPMQEAIAKEFQALNALLKPTLKIIANVNMPMQCMMQGICGQCLIMDENGPQFCCKNQEFNIQSMPFEMLQNRSKQNSLLEKISRLWLNYITEMK
jgi:NADPH-dependent glutamate synthase beta subunit-like oxidoreductase/NAD(P)H-flavin reductase